MAITVKEPKPKRAAAPAAAAAAAAGGAAEEGGEEGDEEEEEEEEEEDEKGGGEEEVEEEVQFVKLVSTAELAPIEEQFPGCSRKFRAFQRAVNEKTQTPSEKTTEKVQKATVELMNTLLSVVGSQICSTSISIEPARKRSKKSALDSFTFGASSIDALANSTKKRNAIRDTEGQPVKKKNLPASSPYWAIKYSPSFPVCLNYSLWFSDRSLLLSQVHLKMISRLPTRMKRLWRQW